MDEQLYPRGLVHTLMINDNRLMRGSGDFADLAPTGGSSMIIDLYFIVKSCVVVGDTTTLTGASRCSGLVSST
jgi:hypothetical protein